MTRYRYVIVCSNGCSHDLDREATFYPHGLGAATRYDLPELLENGWVPVREMPMGGVGDMAVGYSLILLAKGKPDADAEAAPA